MYIKIDDKPISAFSSYTVFIDYSEIGRVVKAKRCTCGCWDKNNEQQHCYVTSNTNYISKTDCIKLENNKDIRECTYERLS